jgi:undecaprenyl-diphosphatase
MESIWNWGNALIVSIQTIHNPIIDSFFRAVTEMGSAMFILAAVAFVLWSVDKETGIRLFYLLLISTAVNSWAKRLIGHPRPFDWPSPQTSPVLKLVDVGGNGLPSGHAQSALLWSIYLASRLKGRWAWAGALVYCLAVGFSRIYLGVHFPTDVLGGFVLGLALVSLFNWVEPHLSPRLAKLSPQTQAGLALMIPVAITLLNPPYLQEMDLLSGIAAFGLGVIVERQKIGFQPTGSLGLRLMRFVIGIIPLAVIFLGLELISDGRDLGPLIPIVQYILLGVWISAGGPWLFKKMRLAYTH